MTATIPMIRPAGFTDLTDLERQVLTVMNEVHASRAGILATQVWGAVGGQLPDVRAAIARLRRDGLVIRVGWDGGPICGVDVRPVMHTGYGPGRYRLTEFGRRACDDRRWFQRWMES